jgi:hypothetical protein
MRFFRSWLVFFLSLGIREHSTGLLEKSREIFNSRLIQNPSGTYDNTQAR